MHTLDLALEQLHHIERLSVEQQLSQLAVRQGQVNTCKLSHMIYFVQIKDTQGVHMHYDQGSVTHGMADNTRYKSAMEGRATGSKLKHCLSGCCSQAGRLAGTSGACFFIMADSICIGERPA